VSVAEQADLEASPNVHWKRKAVLIVHEYSRYSEIAFLLSRIFQKVFAHYGAIIEKIEKGNFSKVEDFLKKKVRTKCSKSVETILIANATSSSPLPVNKKRSFIVLHLQHTFYQYAKYVPPMPILFFCFTSQ